MKRSILLAFAALTLFSCSKNDNGSTPEPETTQPTYLLKRVTETSGGTSTVNVEFTYNGKQVTKAGYFKKANGSFEYEHAFSYDAQGKLLDGKQVTKAGYFKKANGSFEYEHAFSYDAQGKLLDVTENRAQARPTYTRADINYFTNNISSIVLNYSAGVTQTRTLTFSNDRLVASFITNSNQNSTSDLKYTYNSAGNITKIENTGTSSFGQSKITDEFRSFDDKKNVLSALPVAIFYQAVENVSGLEFFYGNNNPTAHKNTYTAGQVFNYTFSYTYNSVGYPTSMIVKQIGSSDQTVYTYDYIEVK